MNSTLKRVLVGLGVVVGVAAAGLGGYAWVQARAFDASVDKVYDLPLSSITASTDPEIVARGKHLAETIGACAVSDCHGPDLGGGKVLDIGPIGSLVAPNITSGGMGAVYSDAEIARLLRHGLKKDGRSVVFMPVQDFSWLPDSDLIALISFVRSVPKVDRPNGAVHVGLLGKVLDRKGMFRLDIAGHIDHTVVESVPAPEPTAAYGRFLGRLCVGCHGDHLSGGPIPGAPPSMPVPLNLTPHATGLAGWTFDDFMNVMHTGKKKDGTKLDPMMSVEIIARMNPTEQHALWEFLQSVPALPFGQR